MTINVTQADIDAGVRESCTKCPVSIAVRRVLDKGCMVFSSAADLAIAGPPRKDPSVHVVPINDLGFITAFDQGESVEPFTFEAEIPDHLLREGAA